MLAGFNKTYCQGTVPESHFPAKNSHLRPDIPHGCLFDILDKYDSTFRGFDHWSGKENSLVDIGDVSGVHEIGIGNWHYGHNRHI